MYVKSNTNKSTSLFESLKSHSATARKLLEKKPVGMFSRPSLHQSSILLRIWTYANLTKTRGIQFQSTTNL